MQHRAGAIGAALTLVTVGALAPLAAGAAPQGAPPDPGLPVVIASVTLGRDVQAIDCRGNPDAEPPVPGSFTIERTGATGDPLAVDVGYSPTVALPDPVVIPAGAASVTIEVPTSVPTLTVSMPSAPTYDVAGGSESFSVQTLVTIADLGCNLGAVDEVVRIIDLGGTPEPIGPDDTSIDLSRVTELQIEGTEAPGTALQLDGTWRGAATERGIYEVQAYYCETPTWCPQQLQVVVIVAPEGPPLGPGTPPVTPPAPATPIAGTPTLTG